MALMQGLRYERYEGSWGYRRTFLRFGAQNLEISLLKGHLHLYTYYFYCLASTNLGNV